MAYIILIVNPVLSIIMIALMSVITSIISWVICIFAAISSVGITIVLWVTYINIRKTDDFKIKYTHFDEFLRNETVIYATAIVATVIMVIIFYLLLFITVNILY